jgi:hypothetical protein
VMKLLSKERYGSRVKKTYDPPHTPYSRVLADPNVAEEDKESLRSAYHTLDVVQLRQQLDDLLDQLWSQPQASDWAAPEPDDASSSDTI